MNDEWANTFVHHPSYLTCGAGLPNQSWHTENNWPFARLPRLRDSAKGHEFLSLPRSPTGLLEY